MKPLAAAIHLKPDITGDQLQDREFKISVYANDVLVMLTNLHTILPNLHAQLQTFSVPSGCKINMSKTEALPMNLPPAALRHLQSKLNVSLAGNFS